MAQYVIVFLGGNLPASPEEGKVHFAKYKQWLILDIGGSLEVSELLKMPG